MNNVNLIGRLGQEPELKYFDSGNVKASFSLAIDEGKDKEGQKQTTWLDVEAWGKTAEIVGNYVRKGDQVGVSGRLQRQTWEAQDGGKRSKVLVIANRVHLLSNRNEGSATQTPNERMAERAYASDYDDIPF